MKKLIVVGIAAAMAASVLAVPSVKPRIDDLKVVQNDNRIVTITYKLADAPAVVTVDIQTNSQADATGTWTSIGGENITPALSGDAGKLQANSDQTRTILWRPRKSWPGHLFKNGTARAVLTAWAAEEPPTFMVVDLVDANNRFTYYADKASLPGGISDRSYKTDKILFRRIPAAGVTWKMGSPENECIMRGGNEDLHDVTLTEDYYMAVYETTCCQYRHVRSYWLANRGESTEDFYGYYYWDDGYSDYYSDQETIDLCPVHQTHCGYLRGGDGNLYNWPKNGHNVIHNGFFGVLRTMTGGELLFDLPTEAQWEFAARAGTAGQAYFGDVYALDWWGCDEAAISANCWWWRNSTVTGGNVEGRISHPVGTKTANNFDLYDMIGNVGEACLDQYTAHLGASAAMDPKGPETDVANPSRVRRGGSCCGDESVATWNQRSACRLAVDQIDNSMWGQRNHGFRIWAPAVAK